LGVALFLLVQLNWVGIFYAFTLGAHYVLSCLVRGQVQWKVLAALALPSLLSLTLNFYVMISGFRHNLAVAAAGESPETVVYDESDTPWELMKTLYRWRASEGERRSFSWPAWLKSNLHYANKNFTAPVLVFVSVYLLYLLGAHLYILDRRVFGPLETGSPFRPITVPRAFRHLWFFLLPGLLFLFAFKGLCPGHHLAALAAGAKVGNNLPGQVLIEYQVLNAGVRVASSGPKASFQ
jgi:hypothetical protein